MVPLYRQTFFQPILPADKVEAGPGGPDGDRDIAPFVEIDIAAHIRRHAAPI